MGRLVDQFSSPRRGRSPSMANEEAIQLAGYPGGRPQQERKRRRRRSGSEGEEQEELEEEEMDEPDGGEEDSLLEREKMRRNEEELRKISSGIGKVFLDTIRKTERIRSVRSSGMDPRSAARTPAANRMPKYRLRYDSPAWASPSRDTLHARPWDSLEDLACPVVLTSSGCASGCNSDHYPAAALASLGPYLQARSTSTLARCPPSLGSSSLPRPSSPPRPGYTQRSTTLPHIRSVSGRVIDSLLEVVGVEEEPVKPNSHSGLVTTVSNSFSWASLARYQVAEDDRKQAHSSYFARPQLKHSRTLLDLV